MGHNSKSLNLEHVIEWGAQSASYRASFSSLTETGMSEISDSCIVVLHKGYGTHQIKKKEIKQMEINCLDNLDKKTAETKRLVVNTLSLNCSSFRSQLSQNCLAMATRNNIP